MKRIYKSQKVLAGGTPVHVKMVLGQGSEDIVQRTGRIVQTAQGWLSAVLPEVHSQMKGDVAAAFQACFVNAPDPAAVSTVSSVLTTVNNCIRKEHGIKIRNDDDAYGYVNISFTGRKHLTNGMVFHDEDGDVITRVGEIHIDKATVRTDMKMAVITYIHEATHKFVNTDDYGDQGYFKSDGSTFCAPGINWQQALNNADSYAYFVLKVLESKFHSVLVT